MCNREILSLRTVVVIALAYLAALVAPGAAGAVTLPAGFQQTTVFTGLERPMDVEIAPNGRVFVAEKSGFVKTYSNLADTTPTIAADLRTQVHNFSARGLMSIAVDPNYPSQPYIYVYYTLDAKIGETPPLYGDANGTWDSCAKATLGLDENCVAAGRISRLKLAGEVMAGQEQVLVEDWCQQYPVHTGGGLDFGADGYLYFTGGDGSTATFWDYGQTGTPSNPCADPPGTIGSLMSSPTSEGGRLRVQDLRTAGDPTGLDGTLIRIDPRTGAGAPGNPLLDSPDANERRILAYGLRNSVQLAIRPGTNDVWIGDRGGGYWEELDRVRDTSFVRNFGWPCYEGGLNAAGDPYTRIRPRSLEEALDICMNLYAAGNETVAPYWGYDHELNIVPNEACAKNATGGPAGALLSGLSFYPAAGGSFPAQYGKSLFFADRLRNCIFALLPGSDGLPERANVMLFASDAMRPTDLETTPAGDLLYVDQNTDEIHRISYVGNPGNRAPTAVLTSDRVTGPAPLSVKLDATTSNDPDLRDALSYEWDLDGDGEFDDSTSARPRFTLREPGAATVAVKVTDTGGLSSTNSLGIEVTEPVTTLTFSPTEDARVEKNHASTNFGTSDKLRSALNEYETYMRFQLSGIAGEVRSAKLKVMSSTNGTIDGPGVHGLTGEWTESAVTWATRPAPAGDAVSDTGAIPSNTYMDWDVSSLVSGNGALDLALISTSPDTVEFNSKDHVNPAKRPVLEVTFATPSDEEAPTAPTGLVAKTVGTNIQLDWTAASDTVGVTNYEVYRNGELLERTGAETSYTDTAAVVATPYEYTVKALDSSENRSAASEPASASVTDTWSPTEPDNLRATLSGGAVDLTWDAASDNVGVTGYRIYSGDTEVGSADGATSTSRTLAGLAAGPHTFTVRAIDAAGNLSGPSPAATANVPDTVKPSAPANLAGATAPGQVVLTWEASTDNVGVTGYRVYRNGSQVASVLGAITTFTHTNLQSGDADYSVRAIDAAGNLSDPSNTATVNIPDAEKPTTPGSLRATAGTGQVALSWQGSSDNVGVAGYRIYRNGAEVATVGSAARSYTDTGVVGSLSYTVRAFDGAGNLSNPSNTATANVADTVKPSTPANLTAAVGPSQVTLSWELSTDNVGVTGYRVYRNGTQVAYLLGAIGSFTDTGRTPGTYSYTVRATDAAGNLSDASNTATATVPDTQAPTAPRNLAAQAATSTRVDLTWTASSDNVGVTNYEVHRNGVLLAVTGNVTSYTDTTVSPLTAYQYTVTALDAQQNRSTQSNTASVTTPTTAVFAPIGDARVEEVNKKVNFGSAPTLGAQDSKKIESYLKFAIAGVSGPVKSAKLRLVALTDTVDGPSAREIKAKETAAWSESTVTWDKRAKTEGKEFDDKGAIAAGATVDFDVTSLVSGNGTVSFGLVSKSKDGVDFASREFADPAKRPVLIITF